jgi:phospho-N-acetylmuramoyl-pentapeptide-transferase
VRGISDGSFFLLPNEVYPPRRAFLLMLLWILDQLATLWPKADWGARLAGWTKITFRAALAALLSFVLAVLLGPWVIAWLQTRFREPLSNRSPKLRELSQHKAATPTMGGLFLVTGIVAAAAILCNWQNGYIPVVVINLVGMATIGAVDDLRKLSGRSGGLKPRTKLIAQLAVAGFSAGSIYAINQIVPGGTSLQIPMAGATISLGLWFIPLAMLVIVGSSNAVNLTDGLDGLAGGCLITAAAAVAVATYAAGHAELASYLGVTHLPEAGETVVVAAAMIGGTLGFLWFNCQPAQVFLGDTGSLSLGGTLGLLAVISRQELLLLIVGAVFVAEAFSVIIQVAWFRWRGVRIFRCAPLHHHFQFNGWAESKIVTRFWIVSMLCALVGLGMLKMNGSAEMTARQMHAENGTVVEIAQEPQPGPRG